jgi:two-component system sensor histidine kinase CpxA
VARLFWKLFFALWLSIMGFAVIMTVVNSHLSQRNIPEEPAARNQRDIELLDERLSEALQQNGPQAARRIMRALPRQIRNRVYLFDANGKEVMGRDNMRERLRSREMQLNSRNIIDAADNQYRLVVLRRSPPGPLLEPGLRGIAWRLAVAALISALVSLLIARYLAAPMVRLGAASRSLAAGDLSTRIGLPLSGRKDEFGSLARDFDEMASRLQELQRANRRLLRDVSHELRSPLARLRVALEIARNRDPGAVTGELDRIELESERLETLVGEVLDLLRESSESAPLKLESFDLLELLRDLQSAVNYEVPEDSPGVRLDSEGSMLITADRELLWRAFENLVRNALVHTTAGTGIEIHARGKDREDWIDVLVWDKGAGIPAQHLEKIFQPFYRVQEARDRNSGGHGLGLAIAHAAIRRHGGTIQARNRDEGGLEMQIHLPAGGPG